MLILKRYQDPVQF